MPITNPENTVVIRNKQQTVSVQGGIVVVSSSLIATKNSGTLAVGTATTVLNTVVNSTSVILIQPTSIAFVSLNAYVSVKHAGNFVITTLNAAGTETFDYVVLN